MTANVKVPSLKTEGLILDEYMPYRLSIASNAVSKLIARAEEAVRAALVHQRVGPEAVGHFGVARLPHEGDVVHIGGAVGPLIGARQRRVGEPLVEALARDHPMLQVGRQ